MDESNQPKQRGRKKLNLTPEDKLERVRRISRTQNAINRRVEAGIDDQNSKATIWAILDFAWKKINESNDKNWHQHLRVCIEIISRDITGKDNSQEQLERLQKFLDPTPRLPEIPQEPVESEDGEE